MPFKSWLLTGLACWIRFVVVVISLTLTFSIQYLVLPGGSWRLFAFPRCPDPQELAMDCPRFGYFKF